jgi:hypothetical protein
MARHERYALLPALSVLAIVAVFGAWLWRLRPTPTLAADPQLKLVAATSGFLATLVSLLAILLKHSLDRRAELRAQLEAARNEEMAREAENRLKLEASIRAIQLMSGPSGLPALDIQRAGALFTLAGLGQHALSLQLTGQLLATKELDAATAAEIIDMALSVSDPDIQSRAAVLLYESASHFLTPTGAEIPRSVLDWRPGFPRDVRFWAPIALGRILLARPLAHWRGELKYVAFPIVTALVLAWRSEKAPELKEGLEAVLIEVLDAFPDLGQFHHETGILVFDDIRAQLRQVPVRGAMADLTSAIGNWRAGGVSRANGDGRTFGINIQEHP